MSRHKLYSNLVLSGCKCIRGNSLGSRYFELMRSFDVVFETDKVVFRCEKCEEVIASFYRDPEIEKDPVKLKGLAYAGRQISVSRTIAWVGYAKNTKTVQISLEQQEADARRLLAGALINAGIPATEEQVEKFIHRYTTPSKMIDGLYKHVRWQIFGEAFHTNLSPRGLWFQDVPFEGVVREAVMVRTGKYSRGSQCYDDGYNPPYLYDAKMHKLYGCFSDKGQRAIVWPGDVESDEEEE